MADHEFVPGPPPADIKPCPCEEEVCTDQVAWCQVCGAGAAAYQHLDDAPGDTHTVIAGDLGDSAEAH